jgi:hypothetical protein
MSKTDYRGIDYGMGMSNIDRDTGIRFGVISQHDVGQAWYDSEELDYGPPTCPKCGNEADDIDDLPFDLDDLETVGQDGKYRKHDILAIPEDVQDEVYGNSEWHDEGRDHACCGCGRSFSSDDAYGDEAIGSHFDSDGYKAFGSSDGDIFIEMSPYYTRAQFCSPCAPGACYLKNPCDDGAKAYCFGPDWFEEGECPYPVYRVDNDECIYTPKS